MTTPITTPAEAHKAVKLAIATQIAEGMGAILRKFCDSAEAAKARAALHAMPQRDWNTLVDGLSEESASAAIRALSARIAAPVAVVKPLKWKKSGDAWIATDPLFEAGVATVDRSAYDAERAARILSAITIQPAAQVQAEAVAGAYLAALDEADTLLRKWVGRGWSEEMERAALNTASGISDRILALIPTAAQAALARRDAEVREKALREAAAAWLAYERATTTEEHHNAVSRIRNAFGIEVTKND